ncbi:MAG: hypothetical protein ACKVQS_03445 [Fimbriimonadaceae bacterium]
MDPISIIIGGTVLGLLFLVGVIVTPKLREYNELIAKEKAAISDLVTRRAWQIEYLEKGDIKWIISTSTWRLAYNSEESSDSATPHLLWTAKTLSSSSARFATLTEYGFKMMNHHLAKKAADKLDAFAKIVLRNHNNGPNITDGTHPAPPYKEIFSIVNSRCNCPFGKTASQKLILVADSAKTVQKLKSSQLESLINRLFLDEKTTLRDNTERVAQFSTRQEIKFYTTRPTADYIQKMAEVGECLVALNL